jgi:flagellar biosynthesis/type III secretory pathway M-ring protein FliF/YscJ
MSVKTFLEYGATGLVALMMLAVLVPIVRAFIAEMRAGRIEREAERQERKEMREEHNEFVVNHARHTTEALLQVKDGLEQVCRRLNGENE